MESTGVFWRPVFNILEGHVEVILVNAQHIKAVPGRKTDVRDCEWLAQLLEHIALAFQRLNGPIADPLGMAAGRRSW
jgi:transposase